MAQHTIRIKTEFGDVEARSEHSKKNSDNYIDCIEQLTFADSDPAVKRFLDSVLQDQHITREVLKLALEQWI